MSIFKTVKANKPKSSVFDLSHEKKLSCNMGNLVPIYLQEIVPGDKFQVSTEMLIRLAPMLSPMMHRVNAYVHYFFVPNRIVWDNWEDFITGGRTGLLAPTFPVISFTDMVQGSYCDKGSLADYFGLPLATEETHDLPINMLPFRAYMQIYNDYYRDPNLTDEVEFSKGDTEANLDRICTLMKRCWEKDYFTSALPWTQRGGDVSLPFEGTVTPVYSPSSSVKYGADLNASDGALSSAGGILKDVLSHNTRIENLTEMDVEAFGLTINDLRQAIRLQEWLEKNARGGGRYVEQILSHFGVVSSDARLQRAEYLGGGKTPIVVSEVLNTADDTGDMYGHGVGVGNTNQFSKFFEEHGYVIGILSVLPRTAYQQGVEKMWWKTDKFDFYFPEFANLGEQEIKSGELYFTGAEDPNVTFGYQSRYAEYKYKQSSVHGDFRDSLAYWHMGRIFTGSPSLNPSFVTSDPTTRVFKVTTATVDHLYIQLYNSVKAVRPMPYFGTPRL